MKTSATIAAASLAALLLTLAPAHSSQDNPKAAKPPDLSGLHDFDFFVGEWKAHHKRLKERLAASREWEEFDGTCSNRGLIDGFVNADDNVFNAPGGPVRGVGLASYDSGTGEWASWWLDGRNAHGDLDPPAKGRFVNGVGTFYSDDTLRGKPVRVKVTWSGITKRSVHWEQAFSGDGGKTWETNWISDFQRVSDQPRQTEADPAAPHDFDSRVGHWDVHHRRLKERLLDSHEWIEFDGKQTQWHMMGGFANVDENFFYIPGGAAFNGVTLRSYDPETRKWAIWWLDGRSPFGPIGPPLVGTFENGVGTLYNDDTLRGKPVKVRFIWSNITPTTAHWEQAFSPDGGKTWETNWFTDFRRAPSEAPASGARR